jgi:hypothetical protein
MLSVVMDRTRSDLSPMGCSERVVAVTSFTSYPWQAVCQQLLMLSSITSQLRGFGAIADRAN